MPRIAPQGRAHDTSPRGEDRWDTVCPPWFERRSLDWPALARPRCWRSVGTVVSMLGQARSWLARSLLPTSVAVVPAKRAGTLWQSPAQSCPPPRGWRGVTPQCPVDRAHRRSGARGRGNPGTGAPSPLTARCPESCTCGGAGDRLCPTACGSRSRSSAASRPEIVPGRPATAATGCRRRNPPDPPWRDAGHVAACAAQDDHLNSRATVCSLRKSTPTIGQPVGVSPRKRPSMNRRRRDTPTELTDRAA